MQFYERLIIPVTDVATSISAPIVGRLVENKLHTKTQAIVYERPKGTSRFDRTDRLERVNAELHSGSAILIANHPDDRSNIVLIDTLRQLTNRSKTGFFVSKKFWTWQRGPLGVVMLSEMKHLGIQPLRITQRKYEDDMETRKKENKDAFKKAAEIYKHPGGVLVFYPEGSRYDEMHEAETKGLTHYGKHVKTLLPLSVWTDGEQFNAIIHEPVPSSAFMGAVRTSFPDNHQQVFCDTIMTRIATPLPIPKQGFYRPFVEMIDAYREHDTRLMQELAAGDQRLARVVTGWELMHQVTSHASATGAPSS